MIRLEESQWRALEAEHEARADAATAAHRARRASGRKHAIEDFLYDYYGLRPSHLRRWHPGAGVVLAQAWVAPVPRGRITVESSFPCPRPSECSYRLHEARTFVTRGESSC